MTGSGDAHDPLDDVLAQAQVDAVRAALQPAETVEDVAAVTAQVRAALAWVEREHGLDAVRTLLVDTIFDLAEALTVIGAAEGRDAHEVLDGWLHAVELPSE